MYSKGCILDLETFTSKMNINKAAPPWPGIETMKLPLWRIAAVRSLTWTKVTG